jgi:hypothetical protein
MSKLVVALLAAVFGMSVLADTGTSVRADANVVDLQKSVVNIETNSLGGHGSGTFIDPLHILTVWHVTQGLKPDQKLKVRTYDGTTYETTGEFVTSPGSDIGILSIDPNKPFTGTPAKVQCGTVPPLTHLINIGNPLQFDFVATNMYSTGGRLSPLALSKINDEPKASPPDAIKPDSLLKKKKKKQKTEAKKKEEETNDIKPDERKRVFSNIFIVNGPVVSGMSGSALFDANTGNIVGVLHVTFTAETGSLTGLGAAVEISGGNCQWIKDTVGENVFAK